MQQQYSLAGSTSGQAQQSTPNSRAQLQRRRYSSVKYNRLLSSKDKFENIAVLNESSVESAVPPCHCRQSCEGNNNNVQQTRSNPLICTQQPNCCSGGHSPSSAVINSSVDSHTAVKRGASYNSYTNNYYSVDRKSSSGSSITGMRTSVKPNGGKNQSSKHKQKQLSVGPPCLHISFDTAASSRPMNDRLDLLPLSLSSDNFRHYDHRGSQLRQGQRSRNSGGCLAESPRILSSSPSPLRCSKEIQRSKNFNYLEQSEIAEISANYMRLSGALQQFRGILSAPEKTNSFGKTFSLSLEKESTIGGPALFGDNFKHSSIDKKSISRNQSEETTAKQSITNANADNQNFRLQVSYRLRRRNELFEMRRKMCDYAFAVAILGIIFMIVENELTATYGCKEYKASRYSYCLKSLIVLFTLILLVLVVAYHALEVKLFMSDNGCEDWRIAVNSRRVVQLSLELLACAICPIPGEFYFSWTTVHADGATITTTEVPVDVLLSIPMFLRFYLLCRVMLLHSKLFTDASSRSIGALNRINFTGRFVLKTLMTMSPGTVLLCFTFTCWLIAAWIMRLCERWHVGEPRNVEAGKFQNYLNSLWIITITSLTIGYGDMVPNTYCGRAVSVICGIMGAGTSSLVVAVVARKLELSRAEKHVHNFMIDSQLTKRMKNAAANILRETWFIYKNRKLVDKIDPSKIRFHQRKFLVAIYELRKVKRDQRKLAENSTTISDIAKTTIATFELVADVHNWRHIVENRILSLEGQFSQLDFQIQQLNQTVYKMPEMICRRLLQEISDLPKFHGSSLSLNEQPPSMDQSQTEQRPSTTFKAVSPASPMSPPQ